MKTKKDFLSTLTVRWRNYWRDGDVQGCRTVESIVARRYAASTLETFLSETVAWTKEGEKKCAG